jgi:hypothetical protein
MRKITKASGTSGGKDGFKSEWQPHTTGVTPPVFTRPGKTLSLPRLTVHWLSVTRATEGPLSEISGPYFSLAAAAKDVGHVDSLDGPDLRRGS